MGKRHAVGLVLISRSTNLAKEALAAHLILQFTWHSTSRPLSRTTSQLPRSDASQLHPRGSGCGILHSSVAALPVAKDARAMIENVPASPDILRATHVDSGRLLRRVEKDEVDEEGGFGDGIKEALSKLNFVKAVKRSNEIAANRAAQLKEALQHEEWLAKMRDSIGK